MDEILEDLRHMEDRAGAHFLRIFLKAVFPVFLCEELIIRQEGKELLDVPALYDLAQTHVPGIGCGYHDEDIVRTDSEKIKSFELTGNQTIRNLLDDSNPVIGVYDFVAYFKCIHIRPGT